MKKLSMLALAICSLTVAACQPETPEQIQEREQKEQEEATTVADNDITKYMFYVIDPRTGLCFARSRVKGGYYVYSPIECTPKIKELLLNKQR